MTDASEVLCSLILLAIAAFVGYCVGSAVAVERMRAEAAEHGAAEFRVDSVGHVTWEWTQ